MTFQPNRTTGRCRPSWRGRVLERVIPVDFDPIAYISQPSWQGSRLGLHRIQAMLDFLGRPQNRLKFVHVAGTNGKGSVCAYIASVLQRCGYRTGLFTSPFIETFEERMRIDGRNISSEDLRRATLQVKEAVESLEEPPTEFEIMCAVAMVYFAEKECDLVVLEVGLGGRFDATNAIGSPEVAVITRIGMDHVQVLGDTLGKIAFEKAGIVKPGATVVSWPQEREAADVIARVCRDCNAPLLFSDFSQLKVEPLRIDRKVDDASSIRRRFSYRGLDFETGLLASYQPGNAAVAIDALLALRRLGWNVGDDALREGVAAATWPGRFEIVRTNPLAIIDGSHNLQGVQALVQTLQELLPRVRPIFITGMLADKDHEAMVRTIAPMASAFVIVEPESPRALSSNDLAQETSRICREIGLRHMFVVPAANEDQAVLAARELAGNAGVICCVGSLYTVAGMKAAFGRA